MIIRIEFGAAVPYSRQRREHAFEAEDGWTIQELEMGRVRLTKGDIEVIVQDMPYSLTMGPDPTVEHPTPGVGVYNAPKTDPKRKK